MILDLTKRYFIIGKYKESDNIEYIIGRTDYKDIDGNLKKGFFAENYFLKNSNTKKEKEKFYLEYTHTREDAEKILKQYRRYNPTKCNSWYHKPITYLKRASKGIQVK